MALFSETHSLGDEVLSEKASFSGQESGGWAEGERALEAVSRGRRGGVEGQLSEKTDACVLVCVSLETRLGCILFRTWQPRSYVQNFIDFQPFHI